MSSGWFFSIAWCLVIVAGLIGFYWWVKQPKDAYDELLEKLYQEEGDESGN